MDIFLVDMYLPGKLKTAMFEKKTIAEVVARKKIMFRTAFFPPTAYQIHQISV